MPRLSPKTVLMLDHEPMMIDRRIVLEAQSLVEAGYRVVLATRGDGVKPLVEDERGMTVMRFPRNNGGVDPVADSLRKIHQWFACPGSPEIKRKIDERLFFLPRFLRAFIYGLICPELFAAGLRRRVPLLNRILGRALEPAVFVLLRPTRLKPYFTVLRERRKVRAPGQFEPWQQEIFEWAVTELRPAVVHAHDLPNLPLGLEIARRVSARLVYDAHELYPLQHFASETHRASLADLERRLIGNADAVIAVNRQCREVMAQTYADLPEVVILSNATESPKGFDPAKRQRLWHERFGLDPAVRVMVFQGGINPVRNVDPLVRALARLPDHIHVGFITYRKDVPYYESLTRQLGVHHRVHYVLEIPWHEVNDWLASADVGVMPYQATSFNAKISSPNKLFEFVVAGLPIVASSELENVKEAIDHFGLGVYRFLREDDSYVGAIADMFDEAKGGCERFRPAVLAARHAFTWDNEAPRLLALYDKLCKVAA